MLVYVMLSPAPRIIQPPIPGDAAAHAPQSYAFGVKVLDFNENGLLESATDARELRRFDDASRLELDEPYRESFGDEGRWIASAHFGELYESQDLLVLSDNVHLHYSDDNVEFASEAMTINMARRSAESRVPVRVWQDANETRADRLYISLDRQIATLSGDVRTVYAPES
jgi:LPS export ABC transporter protein LptC